MCHMKQNLASKQTKLKPILKAMFNLPQICRQKLLVNLLVEAGEIISAKVRSSSSSSSSSSISSCSCSISSSNSRSYKHQIIMLQCLEAYKVKQPTNQPKKKPIIQL